MSVDLLSDRTGEMRLALAKVAKEGLQPLLEALAPWTLGIDPISRMPGFSGCVQLKRELQNVGDNQTVIDSLLAQVQENLIDAYSANTAKFGGEGDAVRDHRKIW